MPMIELKDITKIHPLGTTRVTALKEVKLSIENGEFIALWGPSGSGKTSLLNIIGLLDKPTDGNLNVFGEEVNHVTDKVLAGLRSNNIGYVFQHFNLIDVLDATENVMLPLQIRGINVSQARKRATKMLEEVGVGNLAKHKPKKMSGGQQQRVAIARALITEPSLVLADEPTANLDSDTGEHIIGLMSKLNQEKGTTFIFSTHDQNIINNAKRIVKVKDGSITSDEVKK